jgi:hypothetical protein
MPTTAKNLEDFACFDRFTGKALPDANPLYLKIYLRERREGEMLDRLKKMLVGDNPDAPNWQSALHISFTGAADFDLNTALGMLASALVENDRFPMEIAKHGSTVWVRTAA